MAAIEIKDLEVSKEIDGKAMAKISGGAGFKAFSAPDGWTLVSQSAPLRTNAGQIYLPSKDITGGFELMTKFQYETTVTLKHTEYGTS